MTEERYLAATFDTLTVNNWRTIVEKAVEQAKDGDHLARQWLAGYLLPAPGELTPGDGDAGGLTADDIVWKLEGGRRATVIDAEWIEREAERLVRNEESKGVFRRGRFARTSPVRNTWMAVITRCYASKIGLTRLRPSSSMRLRWSSDTRPRAQTAQCTARVRWLFASGLEPAVVSAKLFYFPLVDC